jgi:hypothetical protein
MYVWYEYIYAWQRPRCTTKDRPAVLSERLHHDVEVCLGPGLVLRLWPILAWGLDLGQVAHIMFGFGLGLNDSNQTLYTTFWTFFVFFTRKVACNCAHHTLVTHHTELRTSIERCVTTFTWHACYPVSYDGTGHAGLLGIPGQCQATN